MTPLDQTVASLLGALGAAALKAMLLLALAAGAASLLRRQSAALKHAIWTIGLGATMGVLVLPAVVPAWRVIPLPELSHDAARPNARVVLAAPADVGNASEHDESAVGPAGVALRVSSHDRWPSLLAALWLAGAILVLARYIFSLVILRRLRLGARTLDDSAHAALGHRLAADLHIRRTVTFLSSDDIELPLTWGLIHPRVVLPGHADDWHADRLRHVLQHELAHVKRLDAATQLVASAACAIFWFHPLVWHATRRMRHERERACDDRVLALGVVPSAYASDLLSLVDAYGPTDRHIAALAIAGGSMLEGRLLALLDPTIERGAAPRGHLAIGLLLALLFVIPAAALRAASPSRTIIPAAIRRAESAPETATLVPASDTAPASALRRGARSLRVTDLFDGCPAGGTSHAHDDRDPADGRTLWTASVRSGDCSAELTAHGDVTFNRDVTGLERISDDGDLDITARIHGHTTRLQARTSGAGAIAYTFVRNGRPTDFDAEGRAWLGSFLMTLDRHTAFAVDRRLPLLLEAGGASTALDEIDAMRTQHSRVVYLVALGASAALTDGDLDHALAIVARLTDDHFRLEGLLALARRNRFDGARLDAYLNIAAGLQSVDERRRAIAAVTHR